MAVWYSCVESAESHLLTLHRTLTRSAVCRTHFSLADSYHSFLQAFSQPLGPHMAFATVAAIGYSSDLPSRVLSIHHIMASSVTCAPGSFPRSALNFAIPDFFMAVRAAPWNPQAFKNPFTKDSDP